jgi:hypothetical protein
LLSSARGAVASHPLYAKIEKTTARKRDPFSDVCRIERGEAEAPGPRARETVHSERQHDHHLRKTGDDEHPLRDANAPVGRPGDEPDAGRRPEPDRDVDAVLAPHGGREHRAREVRKDERRSERQPQRHVPAREKAGAWVQRSSDPRVPAPGGRKGLRELIHGERERKQDRPGEQICERRGETGQTHGENERGHDRERRRDRGDALHEDAEKTDAVLCELGARCRALLDSFTVKVRRRMAADLQFDQGSRIVVLSSGKLH